MRTLLSLKMKVLEWSINLNLKIKNEFNKWFEGFRLHIEKAHHPDKDPFDAEESFGSEDDDDDDNDDDDNDDDKDNNDEEEDDSFYPVESQIKKTKEIAIF